MINLKAKRYITFASLMFIAIYMIWFVPYEERVGDAGIYVVQLIRSSLIDGGEITISGDKYRLAIAFERAFLELFSGFAAIVFVYLAYFWEKDKEQKTNYYATMYWKLKNNGDYNYTRYLDFLFAEMDGNLKAVWDTLEKFDPSNQNGLHQR